MEHIISQVEVFEFEDGMPQNITFDVIESELLAINRPTVQVYGS